MSNEAIQSDKLEKSQVCLLKAKAFLNGLAIAMFFIASLTVGYGVAVVEKYNQIAVMMTASGIMIGIAGLLFVVVSHLIIIFISIENNTRNLRKLSSKKQG